MSFKLIEQLYLYNPSIISPLQILNRALYFLHHYIHLFVDQFIHLFLISRFFLVLLLSFRQSKLPNSLISFTIFI